MSWSNLLRLLRAMIIPTICQGFEEHNTKWVWKGLYPKPSLPSHPIFIYLRKTLAEISYGCCKKLPPIFIDLKQKACFLLWSHKLEFPVESYWVKINVYSWFLLKEIPNLTSSKFQGLLAFLGTWPHLISAAPSDLCAFISTFTFHCSQYIIFS